MATIPSTPQEFYRDCAKFTAIMGDSSHTQEQVKAAHRCVTLRYLGLEGVTSDQIETCAMHLQIATEGALRRGWNL